MVLVRNRYQKWKEHDAISKIFNFEITDVKVATFDGYFNVQKITKTFREKSRWVASFATPHINLL